MREAVKVALSFAVWLVCAAVLLPAFVHLLVLIERWSWRLVG